MSSGILFTSEKNTLSLRVLYSHIDTGMEKLQLSQFMLTFSSIYKIIRSHDALGAFKYSETAIEKARLVTKTSSQQRGKKGQRSHPGSRGTLKKILYEIFRVKIVKLIAGTSVVLLKIKDWTVWRGQPLQNGKKNHVWNGSRKCGSTGHLE
jgi:hypothetical protein